MNLAEEPMNLNQIFHPENLAQARRLQAYLLKKLKLIPIKKPPEFIAAADAAFTRELVLAAVCLFSFPDLRLLEAQTAIERLSFPYRPGFLSFCEGPAIYQAVQRLSRQPDLILVDGQGIAHPRRMGLATFLGIILNIPTVGCAKSHLIGNYKLPGKEKGSYSELRHKGELLGYVLRTRTGVKPVFVSPGHLISQDEALKIVQQCLSGFRIPEPLRQAHLLSQKIKSMNQ
ncbi:MAG: deoxyribonuclease V [Candidatus Saccharicenans sp.]